MIKMKPIIKEGRPNIVIKSAKILLAHLIEEEDIIKGQQMIDPVEILLNLILEDQTLWIAKEMFQDVRYMNQFFTWKRTVQIKMLVKLLYNS